jgi:hypothetical protein
MNNKELKAVIKEMVRQSLTEIFAEMKLESIVEGVMQRGSSRSRLTDAVYRDEEAPVQRQQPRPQPSRQKEQIRESLRKKLHISDSEWTGIYGDIQPDNPIVTGQTGGGNFNQESVSEQQLEEIGLMKDYSKFIK